MTSNYFGIELVYYLQLAYCIRIEQISIPRYHIHICLFWHWRVGANFVAECSIKKYLGRLTYLLNDWLKII